jgi:aminobenzoyl-glutamate utilization protein B
MTETTLEVKDVGGTANVLPNDPLAKVAQRNLEEVGGFHYTADEKHFAEELQKSLPAGGAGDLDSTALIQPLRQADPNAAAASTDVGDVSWNVPTIGFETATFVPGVVAHTWQAAASAGMSIGQKGMIVAAKALPSPAQICFRIGSWYWMRKRISERQLEREAYRPSSRQARPRR